MKIKVKITRQENANYFNANVNDIVEVEFEEYVAAVTASEIGKGALFLMHQAQHRLIARKDIVKLVIPTVLKPRKKQRGRY